MDKLIEHGKEMGLEGENLLKFVMAQQAIERDERAKEREAQRENEAKEKEAQRRHELEMEELKVRQAEIEYHKAKKEGTGDVKAKTPRLPSFMEGEEIDGYLLRFERFARANHWAEDTWASLLSALLTGKALDVYSRLSDAEAQDYDKVKEAILKRYELTEDGFRKKFRSEIPQEGEGPDQYIVRLSSYLNRWIELSGTSKTFEGVCDLIIQEQFLDLCPLDLSIHLRERKPKSLEELGRMSDQYLTAHETSLAEGVRPRNSSRSEGEPGRKSGQGGSGEPGGGFRKTCYHCRETGHVKADCPSLGKGFSKKNVVAQSMFAQGADKPWDADGNLAEDSKYRSSGAVNGQQVQVYRDTGSSRTFVNKTLVPRKAYTEDAIKVRLANGAVDSVPTARVELEVDGNAREVEVGVMNTPYPVLLGNDYGAACVGSRAGPVTTREIKSELGEDKRCLGRGEKMESAVPRYQIPARRQQGGQVAYPPKAEVRSESNTVKQRIQKLMEEDPVYRMGRLRWLQRQHQLKKAAGKRTKQEYGVK
ncbi:hypothetical protein Bbelb_302660 [Branchiostoma belcheri]|nr:hypothetical protein Bbelb_302660 [Branchiostoma belcheri]